MTAAIRRVLDTSPDTLATMGRAGAGLSPSVTMSSWRPSGWKPCFAELSRVCRGQVNVVRRRCRPVWNGCEVVRSKEKIQRWRAVGVDEGLAPREWVISTCLSLIPIKHGKHRLLDYSDAG